MCELILDAIVVSTEEKMNIQEAKAKTKALIDWCLKKVFPTYITHALNRNDIEGALYRAWGYVVTNNLKGGYYEFGTYQGRSLIASYKIWKEFVGWIEAEKRASEPWRREQNRDLNRYFFAFDTFAGMPKNSEGNNMFAEGTYEATLKTVVAKCKKAGLVPGRNVHFFEGAFENFLSDRQSLNINLQPAAIINIDCDLYVSAATALEIMKPKMQQGTILMFDDYNCFNASNEEGERRALSEFLETNNDIKVEKLYSYALVGQAFIVHRERQAL